MIFLCNLSFVIWSSQQLDLEIPSVYTLAYEHQLDYRGRTKYFVKSSSALFLKVHTPELKPGLNISKGGFLVHLNTGSNKDYNKHMVHAANISLEILINNSSDHGEVEGRNLEFRWTKLKTSIDTEIDDEVTNHRQHLSNRTISSRDVIIRRKSCIQTVMNKIVDSYAPIFNRGNGDKVVYLGGPTHGNIGDLALAEGSRILLEKYMNKSIMICGDIQSQTGVPIKIPRCNPSEIVNGAGGEGMGTIFYQPGSMQRLLTINYVHFCSELITHTFSLFKKGGNWGSLYYAIQEERLTAMKIANQYGINFISGAQTLYFADHSLKFESKNRDIIKTLNRDKVTLAWRYVGS